MFKTKKVLAKDLQVNQLLKVAENPNHTNSTFIQIKKIGRVGKMVAVSHYSDRANLYPANKMMEVMD